MSVDKSTWENGNYERRWLFLLMMILSKEMELSVDSLGIKVILNYV